MKHLAILNIRGRFYNCDYKILKNSQDIYKIKIKDPNRGWRFVEDVDLMIACTSSYKAKDKLFFSKKDVNEFIEDYINIKPMDLLEVCHNQILDDFEELNDTETTTSSR